MEIAGVLASVENWRKILLPLLKPLRKNDYGVTAEELESLQETASLLRSPANAKRLLTAVDTLKRSKGIKRKIK